MIVLMNDTDFIRALVAACLRLGFTYHFINDIDQTRNIYPVGYWA